MSLIGDDCFFFYNQSCNKGPECQFRHVEEAKANEFTCPDWMVGKCGQISCPLRHADIPKNRQPVPCYYESQATGCTKPYCTFLHKFPKSGVPPPVSAAHGQPIVTVGQPAIPGWPQNVRPPVMRGPPPRAPPANRIWQPPINGPPPPIRGPPHMNGPPPNLLPGQFPVVMNRPPGFGRFHHPPPGSYPPIRPVDPVIINLNSEESDQESLKGSPMKGRTIVPPHLQPNPVKVDNPLDYFLNAKPWYDPNRVNNVYRRSPSPPRYRRRDTPSPRPRSRSPQRSISPRRSMSPAPNHRRRSISVDRGQARRRSNSLDRSRSISPDWKDKRRFKRRSPSPRRRSKSPVRARRRPQDLRSRLKPVSQAAPKFAEIKVSGPKIVSLKKDKKEEEEVKKVEELKTEETDPAVVNEDVKSLEDIYRERALKSMMEAKRKKIIEQKRKKWETVKKTSESEKSDDVSTQDNKNTDNKVSKDNLGAEKSSDEEKEEEKVEEGSSSDSPEEGSDIDLADDVDIELDAGDLDTDNEHDSDKEEEDPEHDEEPEEVIKAKRTEKREKVRTEKLTSVMKTSIKSRLGLKAVADVAKQAGRENRENVTHRARSIKERLGMRSDSPVEQTDRPLKSGVIKLNRTRPDREKSEVRITRNVGGISKYESRKDAVILPRITIRNKVEDRKNSIKQRLGLLNEEDEDGRKNKKWKEVDEELTLLLQEEEVDIDTSELSLLSKKEKKKLLKKLLTAQGRETYYDHLMRKKKKKAKRKERDYDDDDEQEENKGRRINLKSRPDPSPHRDDWEHDADEEDLKSEEEIELAEEVDEEISFPDKTDEVREEITDDVEDKTKAIKPDNVPVKSFEELKREKEARLKKELAPISLEDIRKKRAFKRIHGGGDADNKNTDADKVNRQVNTDELEEGVERSDPPVRVTFKGDLGAKRRLTRIEDNAMKNENIKPTINKTFKRERQIYVPPTSKQEVEEKIKAAGREVIDYGDMFGKKSGSQEEATIKKISVNPVLFDTVPDSIQTRKPLRLNRGPLKVEVKDATVKTFAEIMAEKKRKRLLAQQTEGTVKKPYKPILFDDPVSKPLKTNITSTDIRSRLSPSVEVASGNVGNRNRDNIGNRVSPASTFSTEQICVTKSPTVSNTAKSTKTLVQDTKTSPKNSRWKRRKTNSDDSQATCVQEDIILPVNSINNEGPSLQSFNDDVLLEEKEEAALLTEPKPVISRSQSSESDKNKRVSPPEKKTKLSDSLLDDFEDELLMDDTDDLDLDLANTQDHDELMREIDELLA